MEGSGAKSAVGEFAIRVSSIDELFAAFDARPVPERAISAEARQYLLDRWDLVRETHPAALTIHVPESERPRVDTAGVTVALRKGFRTYAGPYHQAAPLSRSERVGAWWGTVVFLASIILSALLDKLTSNVFVLGISQGIVVLGWVALWTPAQRLVVDSFPHRLARERYAELTEVAVRFVWQP
jgi:hypothetical protein